MSQLSNFIKSLVSILWKQKSNTTRLVAFFIIDLRRLDLQRIEPADAHVLEKFLKPGASNAKLANGSIGEVGQREN